MKNFLSDTNFTVNEKSVKAFTTKQKDDLVTGPITMTARNNLVKEVYTQKFIILKQQII